MGCCSSNMNTSKMDTSMDEYYKPSPNRGSSKRSYSSHTSSDSSSGVSSACTSPSRRSIMARSNLTTPSPKPKPNNFNFQDLKTKNGLQGIGMLSICDDFGEANMPQKEDPHYPPLNYNSNQMDLEKSAGYYSESMSGGSRSSGSRSRSSSPLTSAGEPFRQTQDISQDSLSRQTSDLEMEMYMMSRAASIMPKSSTPVFHRKEITFVKTNYQHQYNPESHSYQKWCNYLQTTPAYLLHNVTNIPEAVAGQFCPLDFPAYTDLDEMDSAAKRFKFDHSMSLDENIYKPAGHILANVTHTIVTEL